MMKRKIFFVCGLLMSIVFTAKAQSFSAITTKGNEGLKKDSLALVDFLEKTSSSNYWSGFRNWKGKPISMWYGLRFDKKGGEYRVIGIVIKGNYFSKLNGTISDKLGDIEYLEHIYFFYNEMEGNLPESIGKLKHLKSITVQKCGLSGPLPKSLANLESLETLNVSFNQMTGNPLVAIGSCTKLKNVFLNNNKFSGSVPKEVGNLSKVIQFNLGHNNFTGDPIPNMLGMKKVEWLDFSDNLKMQTRELLANLSEFPELKNVDLDNTVINGTMPEIKPGNDKLTYLDCDSTGLKGAIPESFKNLKNLNEFYIARNEINELPDLSYLSHLGAPQNKLDYEQIEKNLKIPQFDYYPQDDVYNEVQVVAREGATVIVHSKIGGKYNQYRWNKKYSIVGVDSANHVIENITKSDEGTYGCSIKNMYATKGAIKRQNVTVKVIDPITLGPDLPATLNGDIGIEGATYYWSTGSKKKSIVFQPTDGDSVSLTIKIGDDVTIIESWTIEKPWDEIPPKPNKNIVLKNILFERGTTKMITGHEELDKLAKMMLAYPEVKIMVMGHTDNQGDPRKNQILSEQRTREIRTYLVQKGVKVYRIKVHGVGGEQPIASNLKEETRKLNRRVEFKVLAEDFKDTK